MSADPGYPIEEWSDDELVDQYRYLKAELDEVSANSDVADDPLEVILAEMRRRGMERPGGQSLETPGRERRPQDNPG